MFDQSRARLDPEASLWDNLTGDPLMRVSGSADQVMVRGQPRHVVGYLKDFLFEEFQARAPVRSLSGGEKARLLLAKLMAQPSNLLILDEPTNDLDVETLDLLQDILGDYDGTVLLVSHDRDFIDRVATTTVALEGEGRATVYPGGWSDYASQRPQVEAGAAAKGNSRQSVVTKAERRPSKRSQLYRKEAAGRSSHPDRPPGGRDRQACHALGRHRSFLPRPGEIPQGNRSADRSPVSPARRRIRMARACRTRLKRFLGVFWPKRLSILRLSSPTATAGLQCLVRPPCAGPGACPPFRTSRSPQRLRAAGTRRRK